MISLIAVERPVKVIKEIMVLLLCRHAVQQPGKGNNLGYGYQRQ